MPAGRRIYEEAGSLLDNAARIEELLAGMRQQTAPPPARRQPLRLRGVRDRRARRRLRGARPRDRAGRRQQPGRARAGRRRARRPRRCRQPPGRDAEPRGARDPPRPGRDRLRRAARPPVVAPRADRAGRVPAHADGRARPGLQRALDRRGRAAPARPRPLRRRSPRSPRPACSAKREALAREVPVLLSRRVLKEPLLGRCRRSTGSPSRARSCSCCRRPGRCCPTTSRR